MTENLTDQPEPGSLHVEHLDEMSAQQCPAGKHADWAVNSEHAHACPWCEIARLHADLASYQAESAQYDRDHERLSAELKRARARIRAVEQAHCWTNEDGKRFVFADDLLAAVQLANLVCTCHAEPVHQAGCDATGEQL